MCIRDSLGAAEAEVQPADVGGEYLYEVQGFHELVFTSCCYVAALLFSCYSEDSIFNGKLTYGVS